MKTINFAMIRGGARIAFTYFKDNHLLFGLSRSTTKLA